MEENSGADTCSKRQKSEDAVCREREASISAAIEALSMMLRLQGGMNIEGSQYIKCSDPGGDIVALKEAVCAQQILLQKLNVELDIEREASATAASEALAMMLRLQGEKDAVIMESSQYKRMAEEKISHVDECRTLFEDVICQKELEIASLEYQIQAYRCKMLSLGYNDLGFFENRIPEGLMFRRNDTINGDVAGNVTTVDLDLCTENVEELNEQVKEIPKCEVLGGDTFAGLKLEYELSSMVSKASSFSSFNEVGSEASLIDQIQFSEQLSESAGTSACSSTVLDIFEIPKHDTTSKTRAKRMNEQSDLFLEGEKRLGVVSIEDFKLRVGDVMELKKERHGNELSKTRKIDCKLADVHNVFPADETQAQLRQLSRRVQRLEQEKITRRQENNAGGTEEQELLKEIHEKLVSIQLEIESSKTRKASSRNDSQLVSLVEEAMLYFWF